MSMDDRIATGLRVAQVLGITSTAFASGKTFSASISTVPAILLAPAPVLAKQWKQMFDSDKALAPGVVMFSGSIFGYLAYHAPPSSKLRTLYTASTTLLALCIPYSYLALEPINKKLEVIATPSVDATAEHGPRKAETAHFLVDRWATVNLGRTVLLGLASVVAAWAGVQERIVLLIPSAE